MSGWKERPRCRERIAQLGLTLITDAYGHRMIRNAAGEQVFVSDGILKQLRKQAAEMQQ